MDTPFGSDSVFLIYLPASARLPGRYAHVAPAVRRNSRRHDGNDGHRLYWQGELLLTLYTVDTNYFASSVLPCPEIWNMKLATSVTSLELKKSTIHKSCETGTYLEKGELNACKKRPPGQKRYIASVVCRRHSSDSAEFSSPIPPSSCKRRQPNSSVVLTSKHPISNDSRALLIQCGVKLPPRVER